MHGEIHASMPLLSCTTLQLLFICTHAVCLCCQHQASVWNQHASIMTWRSSCSVHVKAVYCCPSLLYLALTTAQSASSLFCFTCSTSAPLHMGSVPCGAACGSQAHPTAATPTIATAAATAAAGASSQQDPWGQSTRTSHAKQPGCNPTYITSHQ